MRAQVRSSPLKSAVAIIMLGMTVDKYYTAVVQAVAIDDSAVAAAHDSSDVWTSALAEAAANLSTVARRLKAVTLQPGLREEAGSMEGTGPREETAAASREDEANDWASLAETVWAEVQAWILDHMADMANAASELAEPLISGVGTVATAAATSSAVISQVEPRMRMQAHTHLMHMHAHAYIHTHR